MESEQQLDLVDIVALQLLCSKVLVDRELSEVELMFAVRNARLLAARLCASRRLT